MSFPFIELFKQVGLVRVAEGVQNQRPMRFTETFFDAASPIDVVTDEYEVVIGDQERRPAPLNSRGGDPRVIDVSGDRVERGAIFSTHSKYRVPHQLRELLSRNAALEADVVDGRIVSNEISTGDIVAVNQYLQGKFAKAVRRSRMTKEVAIASILTTGKVWANPETGEIAAEDLGSMSELSFGLTTDNIFSSGSGQLFAKGLQDSTAELFVYLSDIQIAAANAGAPVPNTCIINSSVRSLIFKNAGFQAESDALRESREQRVSGNSFSVLGFNFWVNDDTYKTSTGVVKKLIPDNTMAFVPEPATGWYEAANGSREIPTSGDMVVSEAEALAPGQLNFGPFAFYVKNTINDSVDLQCGDIFGFTPTEPGGIYIINDLNATAA